MAPTVITEPWFGEHPPRVLPFQKARERSDGGRERAAVRADRGAFGFQREPVLRKYEIVAPVLANGTRKGV